MSNQVVAVTGGGGGIGRAIALEFARHGADIVIGGRNRGKLDAVANEVREAASESEAGSGAKCEIHEGDVSTRSGASGLIEMAANTFGRLDVLVNNAGQAVLANIESIDLTAFDAMLAVNAAAPVYTSKAAFALMKKHGGGTIINISSMAATDPFPGLGAYGATKAFVNLLTKALAGEGKPHGIRAFAIGPGAVETGMLRESFPDFPKEQTLPASAIAQMVRVLTQPECRYSSGQTIYVSK